MKKSLLVCRDVGSVRRVLATAGCGSSSGGGGNSSAALASCNAYCDAYIAKACADAFYTTAAECKTTECVDDRPRARQVAIAASRPITIVGPRRPTCARTTAATPRRRPS